MSQENVELVRRGHEALRVGGEEAALAFFDPDIDLSPVEELPGLERYHGHDGVRRYFEVTRDEVRLQDEAQFHDHARKMGYPGEVVRGAWSGISTIAARYTNGEWPLDGSMQEWLDRE